MYRVTVSLGAIVLLFGLTATPAEAQPKQPSGKHDPAVEAQLRVTFARADLDKDGYLDATELAKSFRGANAKAPPQVPQFDEKGNLNPQANRAALKYPDQVYLLALDKDDDGKVSWNEYDAYGEAYAAQFKDMQRLNQQALRTAYAQAQRQLAARQNLNYSRSARANYYRPALSHRRGAVAYQSHAQQDQRHMIQDQLHRLQDQRRQVNYSPRAPKLYRPALQYNRRR